MFLVQLPHLWYHFLAGVKVLITPLDCEGLSIGVPQVVLHYVGSFVAHFVCDPASRTQRAFHGGEFPAKRNEGYEGYGRSRWYWRVRCGRQ